MRKSIFIVAPLVLSLLLTWCNTNSWTVNENISEKELFERNLICQDYYDFFVKTSYDTFLDDTVTREWKFKWDSLRNSKKYTYTIRTIPRVFYSPIMNTCMWSFWLNEFMINTDWEKEFIWTTLYLGTIDWYQYARFSSADWWPGNCIYTLDKSRDYDYEKDCYPPDDWTLFNDHVLDAYTNAVSYFYWRRLY